ncbi:HD domain-containing protein [Promicromonospora sukumoe]
MMQTTTPSLTALFTGRRAARRAAHGDAAYGETVHRTAARDLGPKGARALLAEVFEPSTDRLAHSLGVGRRAEQVARALGRPELLVSAAYLHDIGYAAAARDTGLHQLDGARYLRRLGAPDELTSLVAHHTSALVEAGERHLDTRLRGEFPPPSDTDLLDLLTYCDMTTSATGRAVGVDERLECIYDRYAPGHLVSRSIHRAEPQLRRLVSAVEERLRGR